MRKSATKKKNKVVTKLIGTVGVESGQILIIDPRHTGNPLLNDLSRWATLMTEDEGAEIEVANHPQEFGTAVTFGGFGGDGIYEVFATYENDRVVSLSIDLKNQYWRNNDRTEAEWGEIQDDNRRKVREVTEHLDAHMLKIACAQTNLKNGLPCVCGKHEVTEQTDAKIKSSKEKVATVDAVQEVIERVMTQVKTHASPTAAQKIAKQLSADGILPMLGVTQKTEVIVSQDGDELSVCIGPRDWQFDTDGDMLGCGTLID
jgi:hypothetical protein